MRGVLIATIISLPFCVRGQGLIINPGAHMVMNGEARLVLHDVGFTNNGNFTCGNSTVIFTSPGSNGHSIVAGSIPPAFNNVEIDRRSGSLHLQTNISVSGKLLMQTGILELNSHTLNLGQNGSISGENINTYITAQHGGTIIAKTQLNTPHLVNPGNIGIGLTSTANFGLTTIIRGHKQHMNGRGERSIYRYYELQPSFNSTAVVDIRFHYLDTELSNNNESALVIWAGKDRGANWMTTGKELNNNASNWIEKKGLRIMNRFTLGAGTPAKLPGTQPFTQAYPNPVRDRFTVLVQVEENSRSTVALKDVNGRVLEVKQVNFTAGVNTIHWNIANYSSGSYYLVFETHGLPNVKIVKQ